MAWLDSITPAGTVKTTHDIDRAVALSIFSQLQNQTKRLVQVTTTEITEYRALTMAAAESAAADVAYNYDNRVPYNWSPFGVINYIGVATTGAQSKATARRVNEADGWVLNVTKITYSVTEL